MRKMFAFLLLASAAVPAQAATFYFDLASFQAANPSAVLIEDFESVSGGQLDTPLASLSRASGTYIGQAGLPFPNVFVSSPGYMNFGAGNNPTTSKILTANGDEKFNILLAAPTAAIGMNLYLNDFGDASVSYYDQADNWMGTVTYFIVADNFQFTGFQANPGQLISRFTFVSTDGGRLNTGIDNIYAAARGGVPEPAAWAMMLGGFGMIGCAMRRRKQATSVTYA